MHYRPARIERSVHPVVSGFRLSLKSYHFAHTVFLKTRDRWDASLP